MPATSAPATPRTTRAFLAVLGLLALAELGLGLWIHDRLRADLERDLAFRLTRVAQLLAANVDARLVGQFDRGDETLPAYGVLRTRFASQARAAGLERVYVADTGLRLRVDSDPLGLPGEERVALLASRSEALAAAAGNPTATRLYEDERGQTRLTAFAHVPTSAPSTPLLLGVDASPDFFAALAALRRRMLLLGLLSLGIAGIAVAVLLRLRQAEQHARRNERLAALGGMAGALLHEVRNPLAAMMMYLDVLRTRRQPADDGEARDLAGRALDEGERLSGFLGDFQVFAGLKPLRREPIRATQVLDDALARLSWPAGVQLERALPEELELAGDRRLLAHAVRNLLENALDAQRDRSGRVAVTGGRSGTETWIEVADDGPGFGAEPGARAFEPTFSTKPGGLGLGLTIVERVVQCHGGRVEAGASATGGARLRLCLPAS